MQRALHILPLFLLLSLTACVCPRRANCEPQHQHQGGCEKNMMPNQDWDRRLGAIEQRLNDLDRRFQEHQTRQQNQPMAYGLRGMTPPDRAQQRQQRQKRAHAQQQREIEVRVERNDAEPELYFFGKPMKVRQPNEERQVEVRVQREKGQADEFFMGQARPQRQQKDVEVRIDEDAHSAELRQLVEQMKVQMDQMRAQLKRMRDEQNKLKQD
jgi:hypothetical protein